MGIWQPGSLTYDTCNIRLSGGVTLSLTGAHSQDRFSHLPSFSLHFSRQIKIVGDPQCYHCVRSSSTAIFTDWHFLIGGNLSD